MSVDKAIHAITNISRDHGRVTGLLAFAIWLRVRDERVLELARLYVTRLEKPMMAPDWVRILANASHVDAIDDAADDLSDSPEFAFLRAEK
jgi:hypothetical protein